MYIIQQNLDYTALDYPAWHFSLKKKACQQLLPWTQDCSSQTPTFTAVYQLSAWIKAWFILIDYPAWLRNKGVRIIEVLLQNSYDSYNVCILLRNSKTKRLMHTLLPMQLAILLMVLYIASAGLADIPTDSSSHISSTPLATMLVGGIFPFQLIIVVIMEVTHLCIRTCRRRTTKCFLTWVSIHLYIGGTVTAYTANKAILR